MAVLPLNNAIPDSIMYYPLGETGVDLGQFRMEGFPHTTEFFVKEKIFFIKEEFPRLLREIDSLGQRWNNILLYGPAGCGKSLTLLGLFYHFRNVERKYVPILMMPRMMKESDVLKYQQRIIEYTGINLLTTQPIWKSFLSQFTDLGIELLLLIELGKLTSQDSEQDRLQYEIVALAASFRSVVSMSSSFSHFVTKKFNAGMNVRAPLSSGYFLKFQINPFSPDESEQMLRFHSQLSQFTLDLNTLKFFTNFNPMLVAACSSTDNEVQFQMAVNRYVQPYAFDIKEKVVHYLTHYLTNDTDELAHSVSFLWKSGHSLDDEEVVSMSVDMLVKFNQNLLSQCGLLYILNGKIVLNFPTLYYSIMDFLLEHINISPITTINNQVPLVSENAWFKQMIRGPLFEFVFSKLIFSKKLQFRVIKISKVCKRRNVLVEQVERISTPLTKINYNTMYFLRPGHEAIDCVIANETDDGKRKLYLIQLSVQEYARHKAKSTAVYKAIPETGNESIVDYYLRLAEANEASFIYISPRELNDDVLSNHMYDQHYSMPTRSGCNSRTHVLLGGVRSESATSNLIVEIMDRVN